MNILSIMNHWQEAENMEWINGMQRALAYIEEHLTEEIDYEEVAKQSFSSFLPS